MQIVIDIPEDVKAIIDRKGTNETVAETLWQAVKNGKTLPKGHGRLIDADALASTWHESFMDGMSISPSMINDFYDAPTIIEADVPDTDVGKMAEARDKE